MAFLLFLFVATKSENDAIRKTLEAVDSLQDKVNKVLELALETAKNISEGRRLSELQGVLENIESELSKTEKRVEEHRTVYPVKNKDEVTLKIKSVKQTGQSIMGSLFTKKSLSPANTKIKNDCNGYFGIDSNSTFVFTAGGAVSPTSVTFTPSIGNYQCHLTFLLSDVQVYSTDVTLNKEQVEIPIETEIHFDTMTIEATSTNDEAICCPNFVVKPHK